MVKIKQGQQKRQLYLVMSDKKQRYCLYRIEEPEFTSGEDEATTIRELGKPLLGMGASMFPEWMAFAAVDSRIFMIGGAAYDEKKKRNRDSKKVFIYDTDSSALSFGPNLNSAKSNLLLITLESKIFVFSNIIYSYETSSLDREPRFEMLDTQKLECGWSPFPIPELHVCPTRNDGPFSIYALAAVCVGGTSCPGGIIVVSISNVGTYVFDVDKQVWNYVTPELLPFEGAAMSLPHDPSLCCAYSSQSQKFCAFQFCYDGGDESNTRFQVKEIQIDDKSDSDSLSPLLPPEIYYRPRCTISGPNGLVYFVDSGVDNAHVIHTLSGNRYVEISALQLTNLNHGFNDQGQSLKRCGTKRRHIAHNEDKDEMTKLGMNKGQALKSCTNKERQMGHDEEHDGTVEVALNKAESSKRGKKKRQMEHVKEEETKELILTRIWRSCFFGGPVCNPLIHVAAAFAM